MRRRRTWRERIANFIAFCVSLTIGYLICRFIFGAPDWAAWCFAWVVSIVDDRSSR